VKIRDLSIRIKLFSLLAVYGLGFAAFMVVDGYSAQLERHATAGVIEMKDLVADVLPPPKYIIESYMTLLQLSYETDPAQRDELFKTWDRLKKEFEDRQAYWDGALDESRLKQALVRDSTATARELYAIGDKEFMPAARAEDHARMAALLTTRLHDVYHKHRASIDEVVALANKQSDAGAREAADTIASGRRHLIEIGVAILAVCVAFGWSVSRGITRRVSATVDALNAVAAGDLTPRLTDDSNDDLGKMSRALNAAVDGMGNALAEVHAVSNTLTSAAGELSASAESLASGAHEQAASLQETAASLEEITATVRQSSDNAQEANQLATSSRQSAERGGQVVTQANTAMTEIHDASDRISNIISTIDDIAFQTNILALNAAVEAARAGEQGRGFAVVAAQVGTLSQRSSDAAKEIKALIQDSVRKVAGGSALVSRSGQSLSEILKSVTCVTDLVGEMAAAFREQSTGLHQISTAVAQMDEVMQANSSQTDALSGTATRLTEHAERLHELLGRFRLTGPGVTTGASTSATTSAPVAARPATDRRPPARPEAARFRRAAAPVKPSPEPRGKDAAPPAPRGEPARIQVPPREPPASPAAEARAEARIEAKTDAAPDPGLAAMDEAMRAAANGTAPAERRFEEV
jgi:methyl-accepting chemotaxis protein